MKIGNTDYEQIIVTDLKKGVVIVISDNEIITDADHRVIFDYLPQGSVIKIKNN